MIEKEKYTDESLLSVKMDADRRIDEVKERFETFYLEETRFQAEMKNSMAIVSEQQKGLKERFEEGVSKRVAGLDGKFDKFLVQWGKKEEQDKMRDQNIAETRTNLNWLIRALILSVTGSIFMAIILYGIKHFTG